MRCAWGTTCASVCRRSGDALAPASWFMINSFRDGTQRVTAQPQDLRPKSRVRVRKWRRVLTRSHLHIDLERAYSRARGASAGATSAHLDSVFVGKTRVVLRPLDQEGSDGAGLLRGG